MKNAIAFSLIFFSSLSFACVGIEQKVSFDESQKQAVIADSQVELMSQVTVGKVAWLDEDGLMTMLALISAARSNPKTLEENRALFNKAFKAFGAEASLLNDDLAGYCDGGNPVDAQVCRMNLPIVKRIFSQDPNSIKDLGKFEASLRPVSDLINIGLYGAYSHPQDTPIESSQNQALRSASMPVVDTFLERVKNDFTEEVMRGISDCGNGTFQIQKANAVKGADTSEGSATNH